MGLLDRALKFEKPPEPATARLEPESEKKPDRSVGLLERAKKFRDFVTGSSAAAQSGGGITGLFKRAAQMKERGLFKKAQALRSDEESRLVDEIQDVAPPDVDHSAARSAPVTAAAEKREPGPESEKPVSQKPADQKQERGGLLARAEKLASGETDLDSIATPLQESSDLSDPSLRESSDLSVESDEPQVLSDSDLVGFGDFPAPADDHADHGTSSDLSAAPAWDEDKIGSDFDLQSDSSDFKDSDSDFEMGPADSHLDLNPPDATPDSDFVTDAIGEADAAAAAVSNDDMGSDLDFTDVPASSASEDRLTSNLDDDPMALDAAAPPDPFLEYEREAEYEASKIADKSGTDADVTGERKTFLFDSDDDFTTAPVEAHIAGQRKIDHYLSLFDIAREITTINDFDELWDSILFSIVGQLGAEGVCIFTSRSSMESGQTFFPVAASGLEYKDEWNLGPGTTLYEACAKEDGVLYAERFRSAGSAFTLTDMERDILDTCSAQILIPLKNNGKTYGIVILGGTHSGDEYAIDDLEFVTLLGGITAGGVDRILARLEYDRDTEDLKKRDYYHNRILEAARECASARTLDELYDVLTRQLTEHFAVESYSLVLLNPANQEYKIFAGNRISPASMEKFHLNTNSQLVGMVSNFTRVFEVPDFRQNSEITACYTNDDLGIMKHYWILPLIYQNWLVGFITIHATRKDWSEFDREMAVSLAEILGASFGGAIMLEERESLFRDPFSPLEDRLRVELKKAFEFHSHLSLAEIRVKNIKRILTLNPSANVTQFLSTVGRTVAGFLFHTDFLARIGQGRFAMILPGRGKAETEILIKKIRAEFKALKLLPGSPVDAQFVHTIITTEDTEDAEKMLAILE